MPRQFTGAQGVFVGDIQCAYCPIRSARGMYSEGGFGRLRAPSAYLIAISEDPAAEKYRSDDEDFKISYVLALSFSSVTRPQRKTLVSIKNFMRPFWLF